MLIDALFDRLVGRLRGYGRSEYGEFTHAPYRTTAGELFRRF